MSILTDAEKLDIVVNIIPLIPALIKGSEDAFSLWNKMVAALKDGVTPEEMQSAIAARDKVLQDVINKTT